MGVLAGGGGRLLCTKLSALGLLLNLVSHSLLPCIDCLLSVYPSFVINVLLVTFPKTKPSTPKGPSREGPRRVTGLLFTLLPVSSGSGQGMGGQGLAAPSKGRCGREGLSPARAPEAAPRKSVLWLPKMERESCEVLTCPFAFPPGGCHSDGRIH